MLFVQVKIVTISSCTTPVCPPACSTSSGSSRAPPIALRCSQPAVTRDLASAAPTAASSTAALSPAPERTSAPFPLPLHLLQSPSIYITPCQGTAWTSPCASLSAPTTSSPATPRSTRTRATRSKSSSDMRAHCNPPSVKCSRHSQFRHLKDIDWQIVIVEDSRCVRVRARSRPSVVVPHVFLSP